MKALLKFISMDTLIAFITDEISIYAASTVKNPNSLEARRIWKYVGLLQNAIVNYKSKVPPPADTIF